MPGLVGFTRRSIDGHESKSILGRMQSYIAHHDFYKNETLFCTPELCATRSHLNIIQTEPQPAQKSGIYVWLEGEFYNQDELIRMTPDQTKTDPELLLLLYKENQGFSFLKNVDGIYAGVLYDGQKQLVHLIVDRFGLKPLYWAVMKGQLVWSSEVKAFLAHPDFSPVIEHEAIAEFFEHEHLLGNRTWFKGVELVPYGSVLTFDVKHSSVKIQPYWSWDNIKPLTGRIDERELIEELGRLFKESVKRCVNSCEEMGMSLSGGLDSRAILAALPEDCKPVHAFTFGQPGCDDIRIASKVARIGGAVHHVYYLDSTNWLKGRVEGVWKTDGQINLLHMHSIQFIPDYKKYVNHCFNGFWGDAVLGGLYIPMTYPNRPEVYFADNRGRRFINMGSVLGESWVVSRRPFASKDLVDFAFSLPACLRQDSYIYKKMLLANFPEYYRNIAWQKKGYSISLPEPLQQVVRFRNRVVNRLKRESQRFGLNFRDLRNYTDYPAWIRKEPASSFFEDLLMSKKAIYPEYIDRNKIQSYIANHMEEKAGYHNELCLALTFELWLQQLFEGEYRGIKE